MNGRGLIREPSFTRPFTRYRKPSYRSPLLAGAVPTPPAFLLPLQAYPIRHPKDTSIGSFSKC